MRLTHHPLWPMLLPWLYSEATNQSRWRIEIHPSMTLDVFTVVSSIIVSCPHCGAATRPVRQRQKWTKPYVRVSCADPSCWRSNDASDLAAEVHAAIAGTPRVWQQGGLFDVAHSDTKSEADSK